MSGSEKLSRAMTWHQWHVAYPTDTMTGTSRRRASANASAPHGYQSTGLPACWRRYGLTAAARRLTMTSSLPGRRAARGSDRRSCLLRPGAARL